MPACHLPVRGEIHLRRNGVEGFEQEMMQVLHSSLIELWNRREQKIKSSPYVLEPEMMM